MARNEWDDLRRTQMYSTFGRWSLLWLHQHRTPKLEKAWLSDQAGAHPAWRHSIVQSAWPQLLQWSLVLCTPRKPCSGICAPFLLPCKSTALRVTWQEAVVPQVSDTSWRVKYSAFITVRSWGVGRVNETKKISYMLWSIIKCVGSRGFYLLTNYLLCFLLIQLSLENKKKIK